MYKSDFLKGKTRRNLGELAMVTLNIFFPYKLFFLLVHLTSRKQLDFICLFACFKASFFYNYCVLFKTFKLVPITIVVFDAHRIKMLDNYILIEQKERPLFLLLHSFLS